MADQAIEADYFIIGAGATGMAFADALVSESQSTIVMVDRHHKPGGHWNDAYPFVRLHQAAAYYGVNSLPLGSGAKDEVGLNKGYFALASGHEVLAHFDQVMRRRLLPSGRVRYFPMSEAGDDGSLTSLLSGRRRTVNAGKVVDARYLQPSVPSVRPPPYGVASGVACVPPNDLPHAAPLHAAFVVIGAGKTGMDTCLWLLENGAEPDQITWVMPRDYWLMNRDRYQPGGEFLPRNAASIADHTQAFAEASCVEDVMTRLEASGELRRIDPARRPTGFHGATISDPELECLRGIRRVVRLGRVTQVEPGRIMLEHGTAATEPGCLHVDCTASAIHDEPCKPVFAGDRITLQWVRRLQPVFSAAFIGHVEAAYTHEAEKNRICTPMPLPHTPRDWLRMMSVELMNRKCWADHKDLGDWLAASRVDFFTREVRALTGTEDEVTGHLRRHAKFMGPALANLPVLLAG